MVSSGRQMGFEIPGYQTNSVPNLCIFDGGIVPKNGLATA